jgi:hypothetical protein
MCRGTIHRNTNKGFDGRWLLVEVHQGNLMTNYKRANFKGGYYFIRVVMHKRCSDSYK